MILLTALHPAYSRASIFVSKKRPSWLCYFQQNMAN